MRPWRLLLILFDPALTARVRSHVVEGIRGEGKAVTFCLADSLERL
jgi:hypothetical protein